MSIAVSLVMMSILFVVFSSFHIGVGDEYSEMEKYIKACGGVAPALGDYLVKYLSLQHFEFNVEAYLTGKGTYMKHFFTTFRFVLATLFFIVVFNLIISYYRIKNRRKRNIIGLILTSISTVHTLIFIAGMILIFKIIEPPFWGFILIIGLSNSIFKEFYSDMNNELDRIMTEKYVQRAVAWGYSRMRYAFPDIIVSFTRLLSSKFPLLLSSTFIIEHFSPGYHGLASDLILGIAEHDYFLVMSVTGVFVFISTFVYNIGKLPALIDPR
ncbi:MAG: hypothetical protein HOG34_09225 [Bacteroidetes bacterium]|jgi:hypothetical protein|nr:hypothetical protein [Bacteroidota bacterium]